MFLSDIAIRRPVFTVMLNLLVLVFGLIGFSKIGVDENPKVDLPFVSVKIQVPGAAPSFVEQSVLTPIEKQLKTVSGLSNIYSTVLSSGMVFVNLEFALDRDVTEATNDVRNALSLVTSRRSWPQNALPPSIKAVNPNSAALFTVAVSAKDKSLSFGEMSQYANDELVPKIEQVQGVGDVDVVGMRLPQFDIYFDLQRLTALGVSASQVVGQIQEAIVSMPGGTITDGKSQYNIDISTTPLTVNQLASTPILTNNGQVVPLKQVSDVIKTIQPLTTYGEIDHTPSLILWISKASDGNTVTAADNVRAAVDDIRKTEGQKIRLQIVTDRSKFITGAIHEVEEDILLGACLTILIVFLFLQDLSITLLSALTIPMSLIGTVFVMNALGFTLNMMTTLALSVCIGIIIDDSIVVIENIHRHIQMGKPTFQATRDAMSEIGVPAVVITIAIVAVFLPVGFMEGILGRFLYEFSITVTCSVLISLFVAVTLTPSLGSRILRAETSTPQKKFRFFILFNEMFTRLENFYGDVIAVSLRRRWTTVILGLSILGGSYLLFQFVPTTFSASMDQSTFKVSMSLNPNTGIDTTIVRGREVSDWLQQLPGVRTVFTRMKNNYNAQFIVNLVPPDQRKKTQKEVQKSVRRELKRFKKSPEEIFSIGKSGNQQQPIQITLSHHNVQKLSEFSQKLVQYISTLPDTADVTTDVPPVASTLKVDPNPVMANVLGVSNSDIAKTLSYLFNGLTVGSINDQEIVLKAKESQSQNISDIFNASVRSTTGAIIPLSSLVRVNMKSESSVIQHFNGEREETVLSEYNGQDMGTVLKKIDAFINKNKFLGLTYKYGGDSKNLKDSNTVILKTLLLSFLFAYMVLCSQFESLMTPFVIILSVPLAFSGSFLLLLALRSSMTFLAAIGFILLTGIVKKNSILLLDFTEKIMKEEGKSVAEALVLAGKTRLRPILMTSFAIAFGMIPMAFGGDVGHEARTPLGIVVIGGIISSTILTLVFIPCVYSLFFDLKKKLINR